MLIPSIAVVIAAGAVTFVTTYRPLVPGNIAQDPVYVAGGQGRSHVVYLPGATVQWGYSIRNDGTIPVTITDVAPIAGRPFSSSSVFISTCDLFTAGCAGIPGPLEQFRSFSLGVGQQRSVLYRAVFANCGPPLGSNSTITFGGFTVTYTVVGISHTVSIDGWPNAALRVDVPGGC